MKIEKVLNNNVVVALDENGAETVLMGRGQVTKHRRTRWKSGSRCTRISFSTGSSS